MRPVSLECLANVEREHLNEGAMVMQCGQLWKNMTGVENGDADRRIRMHGLGGLKMTTYKDCLTGSMTWLGEQPDTWVVGYNTKYSLAGGSLSRFPNDRIIEMPLAEALMTGVAIGMALDGAIPILWFERMDFTTLAMDQLVNHLDKLKRLSSGQHSPAAIIRCCVGNKNTPLLTGPTHCQNFSKAFREMVDFPVIELRWNLSIMLEYRKAYERAKNERISTMLVEFRDMYQS